MASPREAYERRLWKWNAVCGLLHLVQAIAVVAIGRGDTNAGKFRIPVLFNDLSWNSTLGPQPRQTLQYLMPFVAVTSIFSFVSFAAHASVLAFFHVYVRDLRRGVNRFRWYEYALSSSLMIVLIAQLAGVWDVMTLFALGSINATMNLFGLLQETANAHRQPNGPDEDWTPFWFGCFAGAVPWVIIFVVLGYSPGAGAAPGFVWAIFACYLACFFTFPVNMWLQYRRIGWWADVMPGSGKTDLTEWFAPDETTSRLGIDGKETPRGSPAYYFGEFVYQLLSLVAKSLLLWLVVGGSNEPNAYT